MSLRWIGPIEVPEHGNPTFTFAGDTTAGRQHTATIGGTLPWTQARQLSDLVVNQRRMQTVGAHTGVLEPLWFDDDLLAGWSGLYLLKQAAHGPLDTQWSVNGAGGPVPISLISVFLGADRELVVAHSSRQLANDFGLVGAPVVVSPFWSEDAGGGTMLVNVGGTIVAREYDPTT